MMTSTRINLEHFTDDRNTSLTLHHRGHQFQLPSCADSKFFKRSFVNHCRFKLGVYLMRFSYSYVSFFAIKAVSYTHLTLPTNREV